MTVELTGEITRRADDIRSRIEYAKNTYNPSEEEITGYYIGLGVDALTMGGGYHGKDSDPQVTPLGEPVRISDPKSKIALAVEKAVRANKASYSPHCVMDGGSEVFDLIKYASFEKARKKIAENLGYEIVNILIELENNKVQ